MDNQLDLGSIRIIYSNDNKDLIKVPDFIEVIDPIDTSPDFKSQVWVPYMNDLYNVHTSLGPL